MSCKQKYEKTGTNHLGIPFHIPNKATNGRQRSCFPSRDQGTDNEAGEDYADVIGMYGLDYFYSSS